MKEESWIYIVEIIILISLLIILGIFMFNGALRI